MSYQCPLCHFPLQFSHHQWRCASNHQFDCAKEGYVNLLPVQHKRSKEPGDSAEMMQARRAFLQAGHYQPLQQKVIGLFERFLPEKAGMLLDIGCGEGYYTAAVQKALNLKQPVTVYGLDVAKIAVRYGAKRYPDVHFCVASSHRLPFGDASLDGILRIYAPCKAAELFRVVKSGGIVLTVTPGPRHLYQLKELIYQDVHLHPENTEQLEGYELVTEETLAYEMQLDGKQAYNLLQMTPFAWKASEDAKSRLVVQELFNCEADFTLKVYRHI
ncbi:23S rRNA (guanine(745)-N(1))-methyltransferase [Xenorhabdus innexi]|uniref:Resistance determinant n=1 Tax=Xenorhabdus innexi TaxID=290109 RepID=A0A1N6MYR9_9GAMM|nr:23S rRNA (guanine(745)-N(1))-methyltransferase [Xenorhabdus innexi]PHM38015.1 putative resistance determinant [Xenorhabdus innexi]SIP73996.1 Ribosomal RNA large subunit methyltransferase A [Xenorhabdus innexi]